MVQSGGRSTATSAMGGREASSSSRLRDSDLSCGGESPAVPARSSIGYVDPRRAGFKFESCSCRLIRLGRLKIEVCLSLLDID